MMEPAVLMDRKQVAAYLGVSLSTLDRNVRLGNFPPPVVLLGRPRWRREIVEAFVEKKFASQNLTKLREAR